jgi:hypothetical protein
MTKFPQPTVTPQPYRPPTRAEIDGAREWYAQGFTVSRILARYDMALGTLYYWLDGGPLIAPTTDKSAVGGENGTSLLPPIPRRRVVVGKRRKPLKADRVSLTARLWRTAERQARDIEERLARPAGASPERERDVRMLAMLTRTLRDLSAFDAYGDAGPSHPDDTPRQAMWASINAQLDVLATQQERDGLVAAQAAGGRARR